MATKKIGIVCDNYKLKRFKKNIRGFGIAEIETESFGANCTTISVIIEDSKVEAFTRLIKSTEFSFYNSN